MPHSPYLFVFVIFNKVHMWSAIGTTVQLLRKVIFHNIGKMIDGRLFVYIEVEAYEIL